MTVASARRTLTRFDHKIDGSPLIARLTSTPLIPVVIAVLLGLLFIGDKSVWQDEGFSWSAAKLPLVDLVYYLWHNEMHASPYYILLHFWLMLGDSEASMRSLSVAMGAVGVAATFYVGKRYDVAFRAALILSFLPFFIQYEQDARSYTMFVATASLATLAFLRLNEGFTVLRALIYIALASGIMYVHPVGSFVIGAHALAVLFWVRREQRLGYLLLYFPIALAWLPMLRFMTTHRELISWIPPLTPGIALEYLLIMAGGVLMGLILLVLIANGMRRDVIALWFIVPIVASILVSLFFQPLFYPRYMIAILPAAAIMVARNPGWAIAGLAVASLIYVGGWYVNGVKDDWRSATATMAQEVRPDDGVAFWPPFIRLPYAYYADYGVPVFPPNPWTEYYLRAPGPIPTLLDEPRVWVFRAENRPLPDDMVHALDDYRLENRWTFPGVSPEMSLYVRKAR